MALSSSALQAVELLKEEYPDHLKYMLFDTKAASVGEGVLVLEAVRLKDEEKNIRRNVKSGLKK